MSVQFKYKDVVGTAQRDLGAEPANAKATFAVSSEQVDGLRSRVSARNFSIEVDEPEALAGADTAPNPVEYVLVALASCQEITYRLYADNLGIPLDKVSVAIEGDLDLRGFFAVEDGVRSGYEAIRANVTLEGPASEGDYERLKKMVDAHCPVLDMLQNPVPVSLSLNTRATVAAA